MTEQIPEDHIYHIDKVLYHWRTIPGSTASSGEAKSYIYDSGVKALTDALNRRGIKGTVRPGLISGFYEVTYEVLQERAGQCHYPNKNGYDDLKLCVDSIIEKTSYPNYEIIIADNGSTDPKMQELFAEYKKAIGRTIYRGVDRYSFQLFSNKQFSCRKASGKYLFVFK